MAGGTGKVPRSFKGGQLAEEMSEQRLKGGDRPSCGWTDIWEQRSQQRGQ